jgi:hypothetical protein
LLLHDRSEAIHPLAEIDRLGRNENLEPSTRRDHRRGLQLDPTAQTARGGLIMPTVRLQASDSGLNRTIASADSSTTYRNFTVTRRY